jgi:hypothetical protein
MAHGSHHDAGWVFGEFSYPDSAITVARQPGPGEPGGPAHAEDAVREAFRLAAVRWDMMVGCPPETKRGLLCAAGAGRGHAALTRVQGGTLPDGDRRNARGYDVESLI